MKQRWLCKIGLHGKMGKGGWSSRRQFIWCESCGDTWEQRPGSGYDGMDSFWHKRKDLLFGRSRDTMHS